MNQALTGADACAQALAKLGVTRIFCITGAGNLAIVDALARHGGFSVVYSHHEQAAVMEAQGYSRITGRPGVALVTTGGGAANSVTGVLSSHLDSVPVLVIAGNESSYHCVEMQEFRAYGVQGFDSVKVIAPISKKALRVMHEDEVASNILDLWKVMEIGRPGPVFLEFPMDLQRRKVSHSGSVQDPENDRSTPTGREKQELQSFVQRCVRELRNSRRPILYLGNGARLANQAGLIRDIIENYQIPFALSWSAIDLIPDDHPLNIGRIGLYGDRSANILLQQSDIFISVGSRLAIPQVGYDKNDFGRKATKWVIDIDPTELTKFPSNKWNVHSASAQDFLSEFQNALQSGEVELEIEDWKGRIDEIKLSLPRESQVGSKFEDVENVVHSIDVIQVLNEVSTDEAIYVTDVGAGLLSGHYMLRPKGSQRVFTSQGLGEMGFGLPGAIGAFFGDPDRQLICLNTDGGIMFNLQELQVVNHHRIPIKLFVFNNDGYGMIRVSQDNLFESRYEGSNSSSGVSCPDFQTLAKTFNFKYFLVDSPATVRRRVEEALQADGPCLIEVMMLPEQKYLPRLATSKLKDGTLISPPLEDLDPFLPLVELENYLGYRASKASYDARHIKYD